MKCCPDCKVEVESYFKRAGYEFKCPKCTRLFEMFSPELIKKEAESEN